MRRRTYVVTAAVIAALSVVGSASGQSIGELPAVFVGSVHAIPVPEGDGAWVLQVVSRGGFTGRGAGDVVVISDGRVTGLHGTTSAQLNALDPLAQRIRRASPVQWTGSRLSRCNDCIATLVVLTLRERDGIVRTYSSFWDSATSARIPDDVREIHQVALNISKQ